MSLRSTSTLRVIGRKRERKREREREREREIYKRDKRERGERE